MKHRMTLNTILLLNASAATHVSGTMFGSDTDDLYQVGMHSVNSHGMI